MKSVGVREGARHRCARRAVASTAAAAAPAAAAGFVNEHGPFKFAFKDGKEPTGGKLQVCVCAGGSLRRCWHLHVMRPNRLRPAWHSPPSSVACRQELELSVNPYSWSQAASVLYVDSPAGTGLSYSGAGVQGGGGLVGFGRG